jgi:hypothetical protein
VQAWRIVVGIDQTVRRAVTIAELSLRAGDTPAADPERLPADLGNYGTDIRTPAATGSSAINRVTLQGEDPPFLNSMAMALTRSQ